MSVQMHNPPHPGEVLKELCLEPLGLSITEAATGLGVSRKTLSAILNGRSGISPEMALRLSILSSLGCSAQMGVGSEGRFANSQQCSSVLALPLPGKTYCCVAVCGSDCLDYVAYKLKLMRYHFTVGLTPKSSFTAPVFLCCLAAPNRRNRENHWCVGRDCFSRIFGHSNTPKFAVTAKRRSRFS